MVTFAAHGNQRAARTRLGCLVQIALACALLYFGLPVGEEFLHFFRYRDAMKQEARFATLRNDQQIKDRLRAFADSTGLPRAAQEINIVREEHLIRIWSAYDKEVKLPFGYRRSLHFRPFAERNL